MEYVTYGFSLNKLFDWSGAKKLKISMLTENFKGLSHEEYLAIKSELEGATLYEHQDSRRAFNVLRSRHGINVGTKVFEGEFGSRLDLKYGDILYVFEVEDVGDDFYFSRRPFTEPIFRLFRVGLLDFRIVPPGQQT